MADKRTTWKILVKRFSGEQDQQPEETEEWLQKASDEDKALLQTVRKTWEKTALEAGDYHPNVEQGWKRFQLKVNMRADRPNSVPYLKIAAALLLLVLSTIILYQMLDFTSEIKIVAEDKVRQVDLPDGSRVWLNHNARLSYSNNYAVDNREVSLSGEAFFEVAKKQAQPFMIFTETTKIQVLGTSFNLDANPGEPVKVQVASGRVAFTPLKSLNPVLLKPGEEATYSNNSKDPVVSKPIADPNYRAWQNKQLTFTNTNLLRLAETLEDYFRVRISIDPKLTKCRFTASFKDPELQGVLDVLAITGDFTVTKTNTGYMISGKECNE